MVEEGHKPLSFQPHCKCLQPLLDNVGDGVCLARTGAEVHPCRLCALRGPQMEEFKTLAPNPGIFSLCDGYSALQPAELVHKNELCKMKME